MPHHLKDQLLRASSSVVLNLSEGSARPTAKDRLRFYFMAFASLREIQGIADLEDALEDFKPELDRLAAHLYRLTHPR
jgi:four helix bundle protein